MPELIWEGKYKEGEKVAPVKIALPFQTIETVNESVQDRINQSLFVSEGTPDWKNRLIWGDKKYVLPSLLPEFAGKINLIYIDPPFDTGADFSFKTKIPPKPTNSKKKQTDNANDDDLEFTKIPNIIEQKAYRDTWGHDDKHHLDNYLKWFYDTIVILNELLANNGSIYIHLDWHAGHYAKCVLDEVFGKENFRNEIVWHYRTGNLAKNQFQRKHDVIFFYSKSSSIIFYPQEIKEYYSDIYGADFKPSFEGRKQNSDEKGIYRMSLVDDVWDLSAVFTLSKEHLPYNTQKPELLIERIIKASSNENDLILDSFCGSGTTAAVAEKLNRRWITCDIGRFAIHTTRKRLLGISNLKPFIIQNLGKYERQQWIKAEFSKPEERVNLEQSYRNFIIELYGANKIKGYNWLHGVRNNRLLHVGTVDAPVSIGDIKEIVQEFWKMKPNFDKTTKTKKGENYFVNGIDVIGWEFAFELNETAKQIAAQNNIDLKFKKIPNEVLEKKAVEQGDIKFYELASLSISHKFIKNIIKLSIDNFVIPPDDIPEEFRASIVHWSQWIDYWAIDWDFKSDTFHNQWQKYRTKKLTELITKEGKMVAEHEYEGKGNYTIVVKVIDILGNDTTKSIEINVK